MVTIRSAPSASPRVKRRLSASSRAIGSIRTSAPAASASAASAKLLEAMIWSGPGASPGMTSSSPVAISATTGRRATVTSATFIAAISARSAGPQTPRRLDPVADAEILPGRADVRALFQPVAKGDPIALPRDILLQDHPVGAVGHRRAGEDAHRLAGADGAGKALSGRGFTDDVQNRAGTVVGLADRVAIHGRSRERRLVAPRHHRLRQNPARRVPQRHRLGPDGRAKREEPAKCLVNEIMPRSRLHFAS